MPLPGGIFVPALYVLLLIFMAQDPAMLVLIWLPSVAVCKESFCMICFSCDSSLGGIWIRRSSCVLLFGVIVAFCDGIVSDVLLFGSVFSEEGGVYIQVCSEDDVKVIRWSNGGGLAGIPGLLLKTYGEWDVGR